MGATTTFTLSVSAAPTTVVGSIAAALQAEFAGAPAFSTQLSDSVYRYLAANHPDRPAGATRINDLIDHWGGAGGGGSLRRAFSADNPGQRFLLGGDGGTYSSHYDPVTQQWHFISGTTGSTAAAQTLVVYNVARDEFKHWQGSSDGAGDGLFEPWGYPHNFGGSCIDLQRRRLWRLVSGQDGSGTTQHFLCYLSLDDPTARETFNFTKYSPDRASNFNPIKIIPGTNKIYYMTSGASLNPEASTPQGFNRFDIETETWGPADELPKIQCWSIPTAVEYGDSLYWSASVLSGQRGFYRIRASAPLAIETLDVPPVPMNASSTDTVTQLYNAQLVAMNDKIYAFCNLDFGLLGADPGTGQDARLGAVYEYDIATNAWNPTPIDTAMPFIPSALQSGETTAQILCGFTATAVESENVVLIARQSTLYADEAYIWKP